MVGAWMRRAERAATVAPVVAALALGLWGKQLYSRATFDDLRWVLAPTVWLVEGLTDLDFVLEAHHGYLSRDLRYEIVPSCSGVNFMIVAFWTLAFGLMSTRRTLGARLGWIGVSALAAYGATPFANAARIAIAIQLHQAGASLGALTPERLHTALGVAVYFIFLCALFAVGARLTGARRDLAV